MTARRAGPQTQTSKRDGCQNAAAGGESAKIRQQTMGTILTERRSRKRSPYPFADFPESSSIKKEPLAGPFMGIHQMG